MKIEILGYTFEQDLRNRSGVYVILGKSASSNKVIDVGESQDVKNRIETHDRKDCWKKQGIPFSVVVHYTYEANRMAIEKAIRKKYDPPCGKK